MACGCKGGVKAWTYTAEDGTVTTKRTEVEALAMKIRAGGSGEVAPSNVPAQVG
jgi:hypothetical protein